MHLRARNDHFPQPGSTQRYLLILPIPAGWGALIKNTAIGFLYAELTGRTPVVLWRDQCLYFDPALHNDRHNLADNAFFDFFEAYPGFVPLSKLDIPADIFPRHWSINNLLYQGNRPFGFDDVQGVIPEQFSFEGDSASVVVFSHYKELGRLIPLIPRNSRYFGLSYNEVMRSLYKRYFTLRQDIQADIDAIWSSNATSKRILGLHFRGTDKGSEAPILAKESYVKAASLWLAKNQGGRVFAATDCLLALSVFKREFGEKLFFNECTRSEADRPVHLGLASGQRERGIEIIGDCEMISRCDATLLNRQSNVARIVVECLSDPATGPRHMFVDPTLAAIIGFKVRRSLHGLKKALKRYVRRTLKVSFSQILMRNERLGRSD